MQNLLSRLHRKANPYYLPLIIFTTGFYAIYILMIANKKPKPLTLVPAFGLLFAVFQVILNITIQDSRNRSVLRQTEYKNRQALA
ncbi:hypothetical protein TH61_00585 [Rufibacter sp. DG15C]|nr:hypothetical protein TH61_00585 [Rufibacter sp. DG15C]